MKQKATTTTEVEEGKIQKGHKGYQRQKMYFYTHNRSLELIVFPLGLKQEYHVLFTLLTSITSKFQCKYFMGNISVY